jgi:hypothetical protein
MLDRQVLRSAIRVVDQAYVILRFYLLNSLPQRVEDKLGLQRCRGASVCDRLAKTSITRATQTVPDHVGTKVKSETHTLFGRPGLESAP